MTELLLFGQLFLSNGSLLVDGSNNASYRASVPAVAANIQIVTHGDSITRDKGRFNYIFELAWLVKNGQGFEPAILQRGINGISYNFRWVGEPYTNTMLLDAPIIVDVAQRNLSRRWLVVFAGSNGMAINGNSAATEYSDFKTYIAARIAAGWVNTNIVVCTMLPRASFSDSIRTIFNTSLVGDDGGYGYKLARLDLTVIGAAGASANTDYFYDGIHPTAFGHAIIATNIYQVLFP